MQSDLFILILNGLQWMRSAIVIHIIACVLAFIFKTLLSQIKCVLQWIFFLQNPTGAIFFPATRSRRQQCHRLCFRTFICLDLWGDQLHGFQLFQPCSSSHATWPQWTGETGLLLEKMRRHFATPQWRTKMLPISHYKYRMFTAVRFFSTSARISSMNLSCFNLAHLHLEYAPNEVVKLDY